MKVFVICPVRKGTPESVYNHVRDLENSGNQVYLPPRNTNQKSDSLSICDQNRKGIEWSDEVHMYYDPTSQATPFDMGMAFAMGKKLVLINPQDVLPTQDKSLQNLIISWIAAS